MFLIKTLLERLYPMSDERLSDREIAEQAIFIGKNIVE